MLEEVAALVVVVYASVSVIVDCARIVVLLCDPPRLR